MATPRPISIAIAAMGGQGGGVLSGWLVDMAEHAGYLAQSTSVPGVAQRTGATIYYIELFSRADAKAAGAVPVMALMPTPGDVDVALAAEFIEAGRAVLRGLVTPDRTTLIASTHREYSVLEKSAMGDARADVDAVMQAARENARRLIAFDMAEIAGQTDSVISSVLLGALAGSDALPFERDDFEAVIKRGGVAVEANLAGFSAGYAAAQGEGQSDSLPDEPPEPVETPGQEAQELRARINETFPATVGETVITGARRCADYQDMKYAGEYVDRVEAMFLADKEAEGEVWGHELSEAYARHLALWMTYEDVIRVASLKTRSSRFARVRAEVGVAEGQIIGVAEFMHPRFEEICDTMPAGLGAKLQASSLFAALLRPFLRRGRRVRTSTISGYLMLRFMARLRRFRRGTLRFRREFAAIDAWTVEVNAALGKDYALATEIVRCQRLIKGYGDTHARGTLSYQTIVGALPKLIAAGNAAEHVARLRDAALADDEGKALDKMMSELG